MREGENPEIRLAELYGPVLSLREARARPALCPECEREEELRVVSGLELCEGCAAKRAQQWFLQAGSSLLADYLEQGLPGFLRWLEGCPGELLEALCETPAGLWLMREYIGQDKEDFAQCTGGFGGGKGKRR